MEAERLKRKRSDSSSLRSFIFAPTPPKSKQEKQDTSDIDIEPPCSQVAQFFADYPAFRYDASVSSSQEFYRMCDELDLGRGDPARERAYQGFKDALVKQFNQVYGTDERNLNNWQTLCLIVKIEPVPDDLDACREAVRKTFVNLVDLVDAENVAEVQIFDTELELSKYTKQTGKFFPRDNAYAGGLLRHLLRKILNPSTGGPRDKRAKRRLRR